VDIITKGIIKFGRILTELSDSLDISSFGFLKYLFD